jgi:hypothetical protein
MATTQYKEYDPSQVSVVFLGNLIEGFAPGTFISVTLPPLTADEAGVNSVARLKLNDRRASIEISLLQTNSANSTLTGIVTLDKAGNGVGPLVIKDGSGNSLFFALNAWIEQEPNITYASDSVGTYTWTLKCADYEANIAGN